MSSKFWCVKVHHSFQIYGLWTATVGIPQCILPQPLTTMAMAESTSSKVWTTKCMLEFTSILHLHVSSHDRKLDWSPLKTTESLLYIVSVSELIKQPLCRKVTLESYLSSLCMSFEIKSIHDGFSEKINLSCQSSHKKSGNKKFIYVCWLCLL